MRRGVLAALVAGLIGVGGLAGCDEESGVKTETEIKSPEGTTTITDETKVEKSGENPPPVDTTTTNP